MSNESIIRVTQPSANFSDLISNQLPLQPALLWLQSLYQMLRQAAGISSRSAVGLTEQSSFFRERKV